MTVHLLDVVPADVSATELGFRVDAGAPPEALASADTDHPDGRSALQLSILGASHAVSVLMDRRVILTEEVSCHAAGSGGGPLPDRVRLPGPWGTHELSATTAWLAGPDFAELVGHLLDIARSDARVLLGRFPGDEGALTAVAADPGPSGAWGWRTWHLYPRTDDARGQGGEVVTTESRFEPDRSDASAHLGEPAGAVAP